MATSKDSKIQDDLTTEVGSGRLGGVLGLVEKLGNKLPNPFLLFVGLLALIAVASTIVAAFHVEVVPGLKDAVPVRAALAPDRDDSRGLECLLAERASLLREGDGERPLVLGVTIPADQACGLEAFEQRTASRARAEAFRTGSDSQRASMTGYCACVRPIGSRVGR